MPVAWVLKDHLWAPNRQAWHHYPVLRKECIALPVAMRRKVLVQDSLDAHPSHVSKQHRYVVNTFGRNSKLFYHSQSLLQFSNLVTK
jgi:hypothetical protein